MAKSDAQALTFNSVTNKDIQTDKQKTQRFWPPGAGQNPSLTKFGMVIEDFEHVLAPQKLLGV